MAERLNAHDSKSCYAGMYTRVQIPFSAPKRQVSLGNLSFFYLIRKALYVSKVIVSRGVSPRYM